MAALAACGGGGGADPTAPSPNAPPSGSGLTSGNGNPPAPPGGPTSPTQPSDPAEPQPAPANFRVNLTTAGDQGRAAGAALPAGGFAAIWTSSNDDNDIRLKRFDPEGRPASAEIVVTAGGHSPEVVALAGGGFLATWSDSPFGDESIAYAQRFDDDANRVGDPVRLITTNNRIVTRPMALPDGGFVLAADVMVRHGYQYGSVTRHMPDGSLTGPQVELHSDISPPGGHPNWVRGTVAAGWPDGSYAVAWIAGSAEATEMRLTRFDPQGNALGTEVFMREQFLQQPALAVLDGGQLALAWVSGIYDDPKTLYLEVLDANGVSLGRQAIDAGAVVHAMEPRLAALADGGFALAVKATLYGGETLQSNVTARRFDSTGQPLGETELISSLSGPIRGLSTPDSIDVMRGADGGFIVLHGSHSEESGWDVRGARR